VVNAKTSDDIYRELKDLANSKDKLVKIADGAKKMV
jgi:hypothetical protein